MRIVYSKNGFFILFLIEVFNVQNSDFEPCWLVLFHIKVVAFCGKKYKTKMHVIVT